MRCSKCGCDNREGRKFCAKCGAPIAAGCPKCGASNAPGEGFCGECGTALVADPVQTAIAEIHVTSAWPDTATMADERKIVTALFADIRGSTELMRELDPEEARAVVDPVPHLMMDAVHRYDGYVAQSTGDGIFAMFGAPAAHEDHPQRALRAALAIQEELQRYAERLKRGLRPSIEVRIGVNTGEVVLRMVNTGGHTEYSPVGHAANLARMQTAAPPGRIVISEETRRLVEGYFELRSLGQTKIKGINEPLSIYEVVRPGSLRGHFELAAQRGLTTFVGRQEELQQIKRALDLVRNGRGQIVSVVAEAGTGKSRLLYEIKARLPAEYKVLEAYSVSHGKTLAWLPVLDLLRGLFGISGRK